MDSPRFRHRIEHTRNKHSRAVYKGDTIIIRLARNLSKAEEQDHIKSLLRRMTHLILQEREKTVIDPFRNLLNGGQTQAVRVATGKRHQFTLQPGLRTRARKHVRGWTIEISPQIRRRALHRFLWSLLAKHEHARIEKLIHTINSDTFGVRVREVRLSFATTQWGSCSPKGIIMLNAALLFVPPSVLRYVIIHELAHRIHPNHSDAYWREVERAMPTYKRAFDMLQDYRLPQA